MAARGSGFSEAAPAHARRLSTYQLLESAPRGHIPTETRANVYAFPATLLVTR